MATPVETRELFRLCETGRLYAVEEWLQTRSLDSLPNGGREPIFISITRGFHSLVELLLRHERRQDVKNAAAAHALRRGDVDLLLLVLEHGAAVSSVDLVTVLLRARSVAEVMAIVDRGADIVTDHPLMWAMIYEPRQLIASAFLKCSRQFPQLADQLHTQANMALRAVCQRGDEVAVERLLWAGANPCEPTPNPKDLHKKYPDPIIGLYDTPFFDACAARNVAILKLLRPYRLSRAEREELYQYAICRGGAELIDYLTRVAAVK